MRNQHDLPKVNFAVFRRAVLTAALLLAADSGPATAQVTTHVIEYHTDALGSVRAVTKQVNREWQVVTRHDYMAASARQLSKSPVVLLYSGVEHTPCLNR